MNNTDNKIEAKFNSKSTWVTLWAFAFAGMLIALRALSLIKPKTCIAMCAIALLFCVAGTLVGVSASRTKLEIDGKFIFYKTFSGKKVYIPVDMVTGVKMTFFRTVCIYAPSCRIKCPFVANCDELVSAIKERLENR